MMYWLEMRGALYITMQVASHIQFVVPDFIELESVPRNIN